MEIELKLQIHVQDVDTLRHHPLLEKYAISVPRNQKMADIYFDTTAFDIRQSGAGLRVRHVNGQWIQTLKFGGDVKGGLHSRHEIESPVIGPEPDTEQLRNAADETPLFNMLHSAGFNELLTHVFTTRITRRVWQLRLPCGDEVEFVYDFGKIQSGKLEVPISEIEVELKTGDPVHLFDFALALLEDIPLQIGTLSKADRGYALCNPASSTADETGQIHLSKHATLEQAFQEITGNCMRQIQGNASSLARINYPESVHQLRIGLRRLRTSFKLFKNVLQPPTKILQELDWVAAHLGAARDWYVLAASTLPAIANEIPSVIQLTQLRRAAVHTAAEKQEAAKAAVNSPRFTWLMLSITRWIVGRKWRNTQSSQIRKRMKEKATRFCGDMLAHEQRRLLKRGKKLIAADPHSRHCVRSAIKTMRYTSGFFQSLLPSKKLRPFIASLKALQDELGWINDAVVARNLLTELGEANSHLQTSVHFLNSYLTRLIDSDDQQIGKLWKKFEQVKLRC